MFSEQLSPVSSRRLCRIELQLDRLLAMLRMLDGTRRFRVDGLPADARVVGYRPSMYHPFLLAVFLESESFDEVAADGMIGAFDVQWTEVVEAEASNETLP